MSLQKSTNSRINNHIIHTSTVIFITIEIFLAHHNFPRKKFAFLGIAIYFTIYALWIVFARFISGVWTYLHLNELAWWMIVLEVIAFIFTLSIFHCIGDFLNAMVWRKRRGSESIEEITKA
jgi:hypothetical protein